jgi:signal transduction histidine kinase/DNA-binding response OmpR family regulator/Flp pilus assembly protein TadD
MIKLFSTYLFLLIGASLTAQVNIDSLRGIWQDDTLHDSTRFSAVRILAKEGYLRSQPDTALYYAQQYFDLAKRKGLNNEMASALFVRADALSFKGDYDIALDFYQRSLKGYKETGDKKHIADVLNEIGNVYRNQGEFVKALNYFQQCLRIEEEMGDRQSISNTLNGIGNIFTKLGDFEEAKGYYLKSLKIKKELGGEERSIVLTSNNIGGIYSRLGDYDKAIEYCQSALTISKEIDFKMGIAISTYMLGFISEDMGYYEKAKDYYKESLVINQEISRKRGIAGSHINIGEVEYLLKNYKESIAACEKGYLIDLEMGTLKNQESSCRCLYKGYKAINNTAKALEFHEKLAMIRDSLDTGETSKKILQMEFDRQLLADSIAQQEIAFAQEKKMEQQANVRRLLSLALLVAGLALLIGFAFYRSKQKANVQLSKLNEEILSQKSIVENQKIKLEEMDQVKSRFFTNISHEFRTPLTIISGMAGQIMDNPPAWAKKGGQMIKQNSANLLNLVNQILDLRKLEASELKLNLVQGDVVKYLRYLSQSYETYAQSKGLHLHFLSAVEKLVMDYDPEKLLRIYSNLLSNAVKYTPGNGNIYLHINRATKNRQPCLQLRVEDTGTGIDADKLPHIFDRFYQVDGSTTRKGEGTGIGLALTKELVQLMNGSIDVKSTPGKGTTFTVLLPVTNESLITEVLSPEVGLVEPPVTDKIISSPSKIEKSGADRQPTAELPTLLIVEDNPDIRQFLVACLEYDYQLETATNGQEGIDLALDIVPDLIISDVMMPEKDGFELCETLKTDERTSHIPIILLTAKADMESKISGLKTGADAYLTKPFEPEELMVRLEKLFELRKKLQARYHSFEPESIPENKEEEFVQKIRQSVLANLSDDTFGIAQLCRAVALSRAQLHNKLKALTGQSTSIFIRSIRLHKAKELLESSDLNVSEVGYEVGFKNPSHFSSAYQEVFGTSPSKTRK